MAAAHRFCAAAARCSPGVAPTITCTCTSFPPAAATTAATAAVTVTAASSHSTAASDGQPVLAAGTTATRTLTTATTRASFFTATATIAGHATTLSTLTGCRHVCASQPALSRRRPQARWHRPRCLGCTDTPIRRGGFELCLLLALEAFWRAARRRRPNLGNPRACIHDAGPLRESTHLFIQPRWPDPRPRVQQALVWLPV